MSKLIKCSVWLLLIIIVSSCSSFEKKNESKNVSNSVQSYDANSDIKTILNKSRSSLISDYGLKSNLGIIKGYKSLDIGTVLSYYKNIEQYRIYSHSDINFYQIRLIDFDNIDGNSPYVINLYTINGIVRRLSWSLTGEQAIETLELLELIYGRPNRKQKLNTESKSKAEASYILLTLKSSDFNKPNVIIDKSEISEIIRLLSIEESKVTQETSEWKNSNIGLTALMETERKFHGFPDKFKTYNIKYNELDFGALTNKIETLTITYSDLNMDSTLDKLIKEYESGQKSRKLNLEEEAKKQELKSRIKQTF
jgi:hypothetical protein